ncbi:CocE/NonD family hydrolase [Vulcanococcus sp.]|uniref:CocE/NonD family hydrolase n=1 Tax=Vulcanococcus sp. TaxID=2856995 RepID=UPI0025F4CD2B|nr:CocE/NonD family hydrolase [Vulcanococcus sp.]
MRASAVSDHWIPTADGLKLRCRVWTPAGQGPWPVLLMRQPYGRAIASTVTYAHPQWYASHGFAVAVQDVRGRGDSEGTFRGFCQEAADGSSTLAWLRAQSWCNGRVGTYGFSYQGLTQLLLADEEQLPDALAPAMAGLDERRHWASEGGCHWWALGLGWGLQLAAQACQRRGDEQGWWEIRRSLESGDFLRHGPALLARLDPEGMAAAWLQLDPAQPAGWTRHEPPEALWRKPMLLIGGWHDPHLLGVLELWQRARAAGGEPWLRLGAWNHLQWKGGLDQLQLAFFRRHLIEASEAGPASLAPLPQNAAITTALQDMADDQWQPLDPTACSDQRWTLSSAGLAAVDATEGQLIPTAASAISSAGGSLTIVHDPWRPLPGRGGHLGLDAGAVLRTDLDQRTDVACFNSAVLDQPMRLLGRPVLELEAKADQPGFDLCAALSVVHPDGQVRQCSSGVARWLGESCQTMGPRRVELQPLLLTLQPGERLRLSLGLAAWPQIAVNPGDGTQPHGPAGAQHRVISVELELGAASLSIQPMVGAN